MTDKSRKITTDAGTQTSDPDALQLQDAPLKQHGDKLEAASPDRSTEKPATTKQPKRG
jgi:hypothetical protein